MCRTYITGFVGTETLEHAKVYLLFGLVKVRRKLCVTDHVAILVHEVARSINVRDLRAFEVLGVLLRHICDSPVIGVFDLASLVNGQRACELGFDVIGFV